MISTDTSISHLTPEDGNVFEDLGFSPLEANKLKIKAELMCQVSAWIQNQSLTQNEASKRLQVTRPRVSDVMRGRIEKFTIDALVDMLEKTGKHVTVKVS